MDKEMMPPFIFTVFFKDNNNNETRILLSVVDADVETT